MVIGKLSTLGSGALKKVGPFLETFWYYAKVELTPPKISQIPEVVGGFGQLLKSFKTKAWKQVTVKEAFLNTLITTEVISWFYIGECIGKGRIIGYKIK